MTASSHISSGSLMCRRGSFMFINVLPNCSSIAALDGWTLLQCHICTE